MIIKNQFSFFSKYQQCKYQLQSQSTWPCPNQQWIEQACNCIGKGSLHYNFGMGCVSSTQHHKETPRMTNPTVPRHPVGPQPQTPSKKIPQQPAPAPPRPKVEVALLAQAIELTVLPVQVDTACPMFSSYVIKDRVLIWKQGYNWHSLPIKSRIDIKQPAIFSVKNCGIKFNHFVAGIIREEDLHRQTHTPWRTEAVLCFQSCGKKEGSYIRHGQALKLPMCEVKSGETLSIVVRQLKIQFWIDKQFQGRTQIPASLVQSPILPYVATFCSGDSFQLLTNNPLKPYRPPA